MTLHGTQIRYRVNPGDVPENKAARRLHLTLEQFREKLPELTRRGFPQQDPTTGMYDLDAIDLWRKARNPRLYGVAPIAEAPQCPDPVRSGQSMGERFATKKRRGHDSAA